MTDVFLSYKREDEARVARLVLALQKQKLSVWWDRGLLGGEEWRANIESALEQAKCAVVAWTRASTGPEGGFVKDEAARAARRQVLVPVMLDRVDPPLGFGELQAIDLTRWRGSARDPFLQDLVTAIRAKMEGRAVPPPQGPIKRLRRRLTAGGLATAAAVLAAAFATNTLQLQNRLCGVPIGQPWMSDACGALALGGRPDRAERLAWAQRPDGDCEALRQHIRQFPDGAYRALAAAMVSAPAKTKFEDWVPLAERQPLRLLVGRDAAALPTRAAAQAAAIERGRKKAEVMCRDFDASGLTRFRAAEAEAQEWLCDSVSGGVVCGFEGRALCLQEGRRTIEREACGGKAAP